MTPGPAQRLTWHRAKLAEAEADLAGATDAVARISAEYRIWFNRGEVTRWEMHAQAIRAHRRKQRVR